MNKLLGVLLLGSTLILTACGGDSDSSGDSRFESEVIPAKFQNLPNCEIDKEPNDFNLEFFIIPESADFEDDTPTCLVKVPNLNNGRTFSLACGIDRKNEIVIIYSEVSEDGKGNLQSISDDIDKYNDPKTNTSKYGYICESIRN